MIHIDDNDTNFFVTRGERVPPGRQSDNDKDDDRDCHCPLHVIVANRNS